MMHKKVIAIFTVILLVTGLHAQYITQGPVIGAVTDNGCKIYIRTAQPAHVDFIVSTHNDFIGSITFSSNTNANHDKMIILPLTGLQPDTRYYYRVAVDGNEDSIKGNFRTFPEEGKPGDYTFVTGSCQETANMKVFDAIPLNNPYFLMHSGDFTYPDYQINPWFCNTMDTVAYSYHKRYDEKTMKQMMYNIPVDYMYDDDDYVGGSAGRYCTNDWKVHLEHGKAVNEMVADTFPPMWRRHIIMGYDEFFPHYDLPDTSVGIYHSFKMGNAEFFVIDRNSNKVNPNRDAFKYDEKKKRWIFSPPPGYALFGKEQMDWLKNALKNSTADWKFIVSGVPLNGACQKLTEAGLKIQRMHYKGWYGFHLAWGFGQYWAAYPDERNDFMQFLTDNNIKNVLVISGDTHHCVMDDGKNAGLPELNASGLSVSTTELAKYLRLIGTITGTFRMKKIWDKGGIGLSSRKCKNGFGKVRIVGKNYVEMSVMDEDNKTVSSFKVPFQQ